MEKQKNVIKKDREKVSPCICGKILHSKQAIYCGVCGNKLYQKKEFDLSTKILSLVWKYWRKRHQL